MKTRLGVFSVGSSLIPKYSVQDVERVEQLTFVPCRRWIWNVEDRGGSISTPSRSFTQAANSTLVLSYLILDPDAREPHRIRRT